MTERTKERVWTYRCKKWRYEDRDHAMENLIRVRRTGRLGRERVRAIYPCGVCRGWHLTRNRSLILSHNAPDMRESEAPRLGQFIKAVGA